MKKKPQKETSKTEVTEQGMALSILGISYYKNSVCVSCDNQSEIRGSRLSLKKAIAWILRKLP